MLYPLIDLLVCPLTGEKLSLISLDEESIVLNDGSRLQNIERGLLISTKFTAYPVVHGIPRLFDGALFYYKKFFTEKELRQADIHINKPSEEFSRLFFPTLKRFEMEWKRHPIEQKTWGLVQEERLQKFCEYVGLDPNKKYENQIFLDLGAGTGQLTTNLAKSLCCTIIGVDLTAGIEKGEQIKKKDKDTYFSKCYFVQASINQLPFKKEIFDVIHASGVLHHTPDTRKSFSNIVPLLKPGGKFGVWLYRKNNSRLPLIPFYKGKLLTIKNSAIRRYTPYINPSVLYLSIYIYATFFHFFYKINEIIRNKKHEQTIKERVTSLFDAFAPPYVHSHRVNEVKDWFEEEGFCEIFETDQTNNYGFNICGKKVR